MCRNAPDFKGGSKRPGCLCYYRQKFQEKYAMTESVYAPPKVNLEVKTTSARKEFYVVSLRKFVVLYLVTAGWYGMYWFYKNWTVNKRFTGSSVWPVLRTLFGPIFAYPLFRKVDKSLIRQEAGRMPLWFASASVCMVLGLGGVLVAYGSGGNQQVEEVARWFPWTALILVAQAANLLLVQRMINIASLDPDGSGNATLSAANWIWICLGGTMWALNVMTYLAYGLG